MVNALVGITGKICFVRLSLRMNVIEFGDVVVASCCNYPSATPLAGFLEILQKWISYQIGVGKASTGLYTTISVRAILWICLTHNFFTLYATSRPSHMKTI